MSRNASYIDRAPVAAAFTACLLLLASVAADPAARAPGTRADAQCELGILQALTGAVAPAESLFIAVLSASPRDSRALTNLGNLALMRGDQDLALAFYDRAVRSDTLDGGIRLNRALALALLGEEAESRAEARAGIHLAGGPDAAGTLLGLRAERDSSATDMRGAVSSRLTREEVRRLIRDAALPDLPVDSTGAAIRVRRRPEPPRRLAGTRAEEIGESGAHLYWKR